VTLGLRPQSDRCHHSDHVTCHAVLIMISTQPQLRTSPCPRSRWSSPSLPVPSLTLARTFFCPALSRCAQIFGHVVLLPSSFPPHCRHLLYHPPSSLFLFCLRRNSISRLSSPLSWARRPKTSRWVLCPQSHGPCCVQTPSTDVAFLYRCIPHMHIHAGGRRHAVRCWLHRCARRVRA